MPCRSNTCLQCVSILRRIHITIHNPSQPLYVPSFPLRRVFARKIAFMSHEPTEGSKWHQPRSGVFNVAFLPRPPVCVSFWSQSTTLTDNQPDISPRIEIFLISPRTKLERGHLGIGYYPHPTHDATRIVISQALRRLPHCVGLLTGSRRIQEHLRDRCSLSKCYPCPQDSYLLSSL